MGAGFGDEEIWKSHGKSSGCTTWTLEVRNKDPETEPKGTGRSVGRSVGSCVTAD